LRDRLPELERYQTTAFYYLSSAVDIERAISVYRAGLERFPDDPTLLANGAYALNMLRRYAEAESLAVRGHAYGVAAWNNRLAAQIAQGDFVAAESTVVAFARERPESPFLPLVRAGLAYSRRDFQRGDELLAPTFEGMEPGLRRLGSLVLGTGLTTRGRLAEADSIWRGLMQETADRGITNQYFTAAGLIAWQELRYRGRSDDALSVINAALERYPLDDLDPLDRPYAQLAQFFASSGSVERARQLMAAYEREVPEIFRVGDQNTYSAQAALALAEGRPEDAIQALRTRYRLGDEGFCGHCILYELARAFEAAGMTDSAKVAWERAVSSSGMQNFLGEPLELPYALRRLGEIYEAEGNETQAVEYYNRFVELWQDADEELQPVVRDVRARIGRLVGEQ
jgi:tetratricopeptide (TPR) repeat protein